MDDVKRTYRETEETAKEAWRKRDGEDLADKVGNLGDDVRKHLGNVGDDIRRTVDPDGGVAIDDPDTAPANRPF
jgi:hypothetical protein